MGGLGFGLRHPARPDPFEGKVVQRPLPFDHPAAPSA